MDGLCKIYLPYYLISAGVCKHADLILDGAEGRYRMGESRKSIAEKEAV
jgi:hypothetical protein